MRIFQNKFKLINLYRLRHMRRLRFDSLHDQDRIGIEDGMLELRKTLGTYKDFGKFFYEVWPTPSITTPPSSFPPSAGRSRTSTPPLPSSTPTSTSSPECTSGKRRSSRWLSKPTSLLLPSYPQTHQSG